jgi:predicted enzyme related to lactoylglutathione lyase
MSRNNTIDYIELYTNDIAKMKAFYGICFGWTFKDYGPTYTEFNESGLTGGFEQVDKEIKTGGPLIVLYHDDLESTQATVVSNGGKITVPIFSFPGGKRFQFTDPAGNELAVWNETTES